MTLWRTGRRVSLSCDAGLMLFTLIALLLVAVPAASADPAAEAPRVLRTFTHHQITTVPQGISGYYRPMISDQGNRILFGLNPTAEGKPHPMAIMDFDGGNLTVLDEVPRIVDLDLSADGSKIAYLAGSEVRIIDANGQNRRTLFKVDGDLNAIKISGDGKVIVFLCARGMNVPDGDKTKTLDRGVFAINSDGTDFRRVSGPEEIARLRNVKPDVVGNPNFCIGHPANSIDISHDGRRVVLGCWVSSSHVVFGCDDRGGNLHVITERSNIDGQTQNFATIMLSGDGSTLAYHAIYKDELGIIGFDGKGVKLLMRAGEEGQRFGWGYSELPYITSDGARVSYSGRHFDVAAGTSFSLMATHTEGVLRYWEYETMVMDAAGRRFAYWCYTPRPLQMATMEINVPWDQLRGAPKITEIAVDPGAIPRVKEGGPFLPSKLSARATPPPGIMSSTGFGNGLYDDSLRQSGAVGMTDLRDDGKADGGDATAGDGIYSAKWLAAYANATDAPLRAIRFEAQVQDDQKRFHASVVEIGLLAIVDGQPTNPPVTIDGKPPAPPTVATTPGGTTTGTGGTTPPATAIDLTGYWKTENGAMHFVRQIGDKVYWSMDDTPRVRNIFMGTIVGDVITGTWIDLPGGEIDSNTGTLKLKIESNDKLTKISESLAYTGSVWTRVGKPTGGAGGTGTGTAGAGGTGGAGAGGTGTGAKDLPWNTPAGQACFEKWIVEASAKLNAYDGGPQFNAQKPWGIHPKYGILTNKTVTAAFAPDAFPRYDNNKYWWMWDHYVKQGDGTWERGAWNAAGVPDLRDFVTKCAMK